MASKTPRKIMQINKHLVRSQLKTVIKNTLEETHQTVDRIPRTLDRLLVFLHNHLHSSARIFTLLSQFPGTFLGRILPYFFIL
jgi:hypothetical protein